MPMYITLEWFNRYIATPYPVSYRTYNIVALNCACRILQNYAELIMYVLQILPGMHIHGSDVIMSTMAS